jgi:hypothetical protein
MEWIKYECKIEKSKISHSGEDAVDLLESAYILAAVSKQPHPVNTWLTYAYNPDSSPLQRAEVASYLYRTHFLGSRQITRLSALCSLSVEDYKQRIITMKPVTEEAYILGMGLSCKTYASGMGINDRSNFLRDYGKRRDTCLESLKSWDSQGVSKVSIVVKQLQGKGDSLNAFTALASA